MDSIALLRLFSVVSLVAWTAGIPFAFYHLVRARGPLANAFICGSIIIFVTGFLVAATQAQTAFSIDQLSTHGFTRDGVFFQRIGLMLIAITEIGMLQFVIHHRGGSNQTTEDLLARISDLQHEFNNYRAGHPQEDT